MAAGTHEPIWQAKGEQKRAAVQRMFGEIAPTYDRVNGLISFSLHHRWRSFAVSLLKLDAGNDALDLCCGTGDFLTPLRGKVQSGKVVGIDFCQPMLDQAHRKFPEIGLSLGDAGQLPVASNKFDAVTVGWGIRNVPDIDLAHKEIFRVLRAKGRFVSLDMARPENPILGSVSRWVFNSIVPLVGRIFGRQEAYTYLPKSTERFFTRSELADSMQRAGFTNVSWHNLFFGNICVHFGVKP